MKWLWAVVPLPAVAALVVIGAVMMQPSFVSENFAIVWAGVNLAVLAACLALIGLGIGDDGPGERAAH